MKYSRLLSALILIGVLCLANSSFAENAKEATPPIKRPRIGLVLEGGGALGFAHVGVLKILEENRVPIDVVAGTSIGSIVGAGYASGLSVSEMEKALSETDWDDLFGERIQRSDLTYRLKSGRNRELYGDAKLARKDGKFATPAGLIIGQNILPLFQRLFGNLPSPCSFDELPLPFRAVTADLETGKAFVPSQGNLAAVVRASMSVPGIFTPVEMDGHLLVDGGIVDNLPVDVARNLGADVLIVSVLDDELAKREDLESLLAVSGQMVSLLLQQNSDISRQKVGPNDVLVPVDVKGFTAGDFAKSREIMAKGETAARNLIAQLQRYSVSDAEYRRYQEKRGRKTPEPVKIDFVRVKNTSTISDEKILKGLRLKQGDTFDENIVEEDVQKIFGTGYFNSVRYNLVREDGKTGIEVEANGKSWLEQFARLGFSMEDDFEGDDAFRLGAAYRRYNLTTEGSYGEIQTEVGKSPRIGAELYQPLDRDSAYFINPVVNYGRTSLELTDAGTGDAVSKYNRTEGSGSLYFGRELGSAGEVMIGATRGSGDLERDIGDASLPNLNYEIGETLIRLDLDKLDTPDFPTTGYAARLRLLSSLEDLGADSDFEEAGVNASLPLTWGRTTLILRTDVATTFSDRPVERSFALGGFLDVSGFQPNSLTASDYVQAKALVFHRLSEVQNPLFNLGFFLGSSLELTSLQSDAPGLPDRNGIVSGSVFLGADTPLLPTYLGFGLNDESEHSFYLAIGRVGQSRR